MTKTKVFIILILSLILVIFFYPSKYAEMRNIPTGCFNNCLGFKNVYSCGGGIGDCEFTCYGYVYNNCNGSLGSFIKKFIPDFEKKL